MPAGRSTTCSRPCRRCRRSRPNCPRPPTTRCGRWSTSASPCPSTCRSSRRPRSTAATRTRACRSAGRSRAGASTTSACCRWRVRSSRCASRSGPGRNRLPKPSTKSTDALGNPVTLRNAASLGPLNDFVEGFIASEARAVNILQAQEDGSALVQAYCAALHMFAETGDAPVQARPFIARAQAAAREASEREQRFVAAVAAWVDGEIAHAIVLHEEQARACPRDLVSLKLAHYHLFNRGDSPGMLRVALRALPAAADVPYLHGMLAFAWEQCHFLPEAESAARHAIAMRFKEPWAHHALAHVLLTQGRISE